jgi:glycosyltransferase involved in cell wall biosynthesis
VNLLHWIKKENSGLFRTSLELCKYEERQGHQVAIRQPGEDKPLYGVANGVDIHVIHSQINVAAYHDTIPKIMWLHGEPLSSVGNGVSMKAITDLSPRIDAFICMRQEELIIWQSIKRTWLVTKGIDLEEYKPIPGVVERLEGEPAVLYVENWRGQRNPLYACVAMQEVQKRLPKARFHLYNCNDKRMKDTFSGLIHNNKWWTFIRTLNGAVEDVNTLYNKADIVVSCLYPLYARGIEAFGAGKAFVSPGYREDGYPWTCELEPTSMADAIVKCWEGYDKIDYRKWAEEHHNVENTVRESVKVYERYC